MRNFDWIRSRLHAKAGIVERAEDFGIPVSVRYARLRETEWSVEFERKMRAGLVMGALRGYGRLGVPGRPRHKWAEYARNCIDAYLESGDLGKLVDAANLCLVEYVDGRHPNRHFAEDTTSCTGEIRV